MNVLATADIVSDMNTLGTADVVSDMNTLGTASNVPKMELLPEDMAKAIEKYHNKFHVISTRAILNYKNEKLLPYLYAQAPEIDCGLVPSTATWEIKFQYP